MPRTKRIPDPNRYWLHAKCGSKAKKTVRLLAALSGLSINDCLNLVLSDPKRGSALLTQVAMTIESSGDNI